MLNCWLGFLFAISSIQEDAQEHEDSSTPLVGEESVAKHEDTAQHCEELSGCGDDGAGQRSKLRHAHEDEELKQK